METLKELFFEWRLDTWANVLEVVGFVITIVTIVIAIKVKSELAQLRLNYLFKTRLPSHRKKLSEKSSTLKDFLRTYPNTTEDIKENLATIEAELVSLSEKLEGKELKKVKALVKFINIKRNNQFRQNRNEDSKFIFLLKKWIPYFSDSTYTDLWYIYTEMSGATDRLENLLTDRTTSL